VTGRDNGAARCWVRAIGRRRWQIWRIHRPIRMLPRSARRVFAAIERAIGNGSSASVSYVAFSLDHHIARKAVSPSLKLLDHLGLIEIERRQPVTRR
jgi:hypothetical protein